MRKAARDLSRAHRRRLAERTVLDERRIAVLTACAVRQTNDLARGTAAPDACAHTAAPLYRPVQMNCAGGSCKRCGRQRGENNFLYPVHVLSSCKTAALRPLCGKYTMFCNRSAMEIPAIQASLCRFRKHFIRFTAF